MSINVKSAVSNLRKWFQYPRPIKSLNVPIAAVKILKKCFPSLLPSLHLRHPPEFQVAADSREAPVVADRGRGLYQEN